MQLAVILAAAGSSQRYAAAQLATDPSAQPRSKLDEDLGGRPVLQRSVELFSNIPQVSQIIVAGPSDAGAFAAFKERYGDKLGLLGCMIIAGGSEFRYQTVALALKCLRPEITHVAVHDAARPCCPAILIEKLMEAAAEFGAAIPGIEVTDSIKRIGAKAAHAKADPLEAILGSSTRRQYAVVGESVERAGLIAVQTPQIFSRSLLDAAYAQSDLASTDDAGLVSKLGHEVVVVAGDTRNIKITRPDDVALARAILNVAAAQERPAHLRF